MKLRKNSPFDDISSQFVEGTSQDPCILYIFNEKEFKKSPSKTQYERIFFLRTLNKNQKALESDKFFYSPD